MIDCAFGNLNATLRIVLADEFLASNAGVYIIRYSGGLPQVVDASIAAGVDLAIGVADFSALVMGAVRLRSVVA